MFSKATIEFIKRDLQHGNVPPGYWHLLLKSGIHAVLDKIGIEIRRVSDAKAPAVLPPIVDDPLEALFLTRGGQKTAFHCPLDQCIKCNGLSFSPDGWHYFTAALHEYQRTGRESYDDSVLKQYFATWQPANALEALIGCPDGPEALKTVSPDYPPNVAPWGATIPPDHQIRKTATYAEEPPFIESFIQLVRDHGYHSLHDDIQLFILPYLDGAKIHGPLSRARGRIEHARILHTYESIQEHGYDRNQGHASVVAIQRGDDYRFRVYAGNHRIAALSALGYKTIPAVFKRDYIIRADDVDYWPQVRRGVWSRDSALRYVDHLFDFDSRAWARRMGFLSHEVHGDPFTDQFMEQVHEAQN